MLLDHERYCDEVVTQAELLGDLLRGADLTTAVPTCPRWTLADLLDHVTGNLREMADAVRRSRRGRAPSTSTAELPTPIPTTADAVEALTLEAATLAAALRIAGRGRCARVWGIDASTGEWARRAANDLLIHRADAALSLGVAVGVSPDHAADALDELLELFAGPPLPAGPARRIVLRATDTDPVWVVTPDGGSFSWRREHAPGELRRRRDAAGLGGKDVGGTHLDGRDVGGTHLYGKDVGGTHLDGKDVSGTHLGETDLAETNVGGTAVSGADVGGADVGGTAVAELRGPLTALLLVTYRRLDVGAEGTEVDGDAGLIEPWLASLNLG
ncbi:maleylpyruvate isomerase family mycothiol-dependent enzyme [Georgenia subflava]|uniref:Maleylpyruvate isomerase family mycothiol-dependent enzyme n=1 Tax=Georgenia subflava TaxID=1622177 RepID=A0A6N7EGU0_9MICO|nr:maleylpyruvate isomerase family mycothiol-dependent enzyme [Georgenia subflava]MPV36188.1 maleylpyruvate isomerase family mycothiol-dependent enzyme [Georgenia subflava]